ncbi:MAG TPA: menaquinone reductase multiheme cytochrome c subunit QrcA [Syntrophobacteria bacterium]|nr:menaquinone reductase multiheme cytochrome c subunit QrcA [Syntrophobacteria bacterium]
MSGEKKQQGSDKVGWILFIVGLVGGLFVGWVLFPQVLYSTQQQPLNFNHVAHVEGGGMACEDCHQFRPDGTYAGLPGVDSCAGCHQAPMVSGDTKTEEKLIAEYIEPGKAIPWVSYSWQPDNVFFSHAAHVKMGQMKCTECHRDVLKEAKTPPVKINRLTGYGGETMKMYVCEDCHAAKNVPNGCDVCHK